eukprot:15103145-Alexandrium_andersonii.AAC.1
MEHETTDPAEGNDDVTGTTEEWQEPRMVSMPEEPTRKEFAEHQLTRIPFRAWCPHCVGGKA